MDSGETDLLRKYNNVYLEIIMKYKDHIEESERLNVSDLPKLVTPDDEAVSAMCDSFRAVFGNYSYAQNFEAAADSAFRYVRKSITDISLPIQFWQLPGETIKRGAGDSFDKAVLLCSMLINLGNIASRVVIAFRGDNRSFMVYAASEKGIRVFDINNDVREYGNIRELLGELGVSDDTEASAYEFNNSVYNNLL